MIAPDPHVARVLECGEAERLLTCHPLAVRVFLGLFWGPYSERAGVVHARPAVLADDLRTSKRAVLAALAELVSNSLIVHDPDAMIAARHGFELRHLPPTRANRVAWLRGLRGLRDCLIVRQAIEHIEAELERSTERSTERSIDPARALTKSWSPGVLNNHPYAPSVHAPSGGVDPGEPPPKSKPRGAAPFKPPTLDEVTAYMLDRECFSTIEAEKFCDFYASKGWKVGKNPMKDWKAAVRNWLRGRDTPPAGRPAATVALKPGDRGYWHDYANDPAVIGKDW